MHIYEHFQLFQYIRGLNQVDEAIVWIDKTLAISPKHVESLCQKGRLISKQIKRPMFMNLLVITQQIRELNKYNKSLKLFDQALSINQNHNYSLCGQGQCLKRIKSIIYSYKFNKNTKKLGFIQNNHQRQIQRIIGQRTKQYSK